MKTTVEIPDDLFRQAKAKAAMEGISLRELMTHGLILALEQPPSATRRRASFPLIKATTPVPPITADEVAATLTNMEDEEAREHAGFMRR